MIITLEDVEELWRMGNELTAERQRLRREYVMAQLREQVVARRRDIVRALREGFTNVLIILGDGTQVRAYSTQPIGNVNGLIIMHSDIGELHIAVAGEQAQLNNVIWNIIGTGLVLTPEQQRLVNERNRRNQEERNREIGLLYEGGTPLQQIYLEQHGARAA